ncbi:hypothetical protein FHX12_004258 [Rhizobium sp. BK609]|nr:hypothetical protein [Rhizobium sp. BK098]MBB3617265.1 hypothetical protein [Rhizobium sp. BK609]MBB3682899.1 hypothetical protein [Rhizobium sp. BK612]
MPARVSLILFLLSAGAFLCVIAAGLLSIPLPH